MKAFSVDGARIIAERGESGWYYDIRKPADQIAHPTTVDGESFFIIFGPTTMRGWAPKLRDIRRIAARA